MSLDKMWATRAMQSIEDSLKEIQKNIKNSNNNIMENIDWKITIANKCLTHLTLALKWVPLTPNPNLQNESLTLISTMSP